mmetsp:Transcript_6072/g.10472  ORF Transcript_6072/g.10472 Transcript_6072/m.10472 type:complete len:169 (+) Transcript_6072:72-578(+)|eukprot:CAMPEP_0196664854 /NCGR_PEP_ID=MMETSP1086-20130531/58701_1 /TAXON_ID=77921 /ORGANISM="Cyanoptyche  gloeocystis , Strain SAG4.97" /LENGTH=168 /DNA_ID=CAMNT_0042001339 /DNA_START=48 /DNA_END=554 /DNA_ORIENTATION=+
MAKQERNAFDMLLEDHNRVRTLLSKFDEAKSHGEKETIIEQVAKEIIAHDFLERTIVYPCLAIQVEKGVELTQHSVKEHEQVEDLVEKAEKIKHHPERKQALDLMHKLRDLFLHHIEEEEKELFPKLREHIKGHQLKLISEDIINAKPNAPTTSEAFKAALREAQIVK